MKTLRLISMAVLAVVMCGNFIACSKDDENEVTTSAIEGTWSYNSNDEDMSTGKFTFNKDGSFIREGEDDLDYEEKYHNTYKLNKNKLLLIFNDNDDYTDGTINISGNHATYRYTWHDYDGKWDDDTEYTMTLTKE